MTFYVSFYPLFTLFILIHVTIFFRLPADSRHQNGCLRNPFPFPHFSPALWDWEYHFPSHRHPNTLPTPSPRVINLSPYIIQFPPSRSRPHVPPMTPGLVIKIRVTSNHSHLQLFPIPGAYTPPLLLAWSTQFTFK